MICVCIIYIYIERERERERESRSHFGSSRERFKDRRGPFCLFLSFSACFGPPCSKPGALPSSLAPSSSAAIAEQRPDNPCPERAHRFSRRDRCARLLYGDRCCDRPWGLPLQLPDGHRRSCSTSSSRRCEPQVRSWRARGTLNQCRWTPHRESGGARTPSQL